MAAFDYTIDYAQRAIDLARAGASDHLVVAALADRDKKKKDLGLSDKVAGSDSALKEYISMITAGRGSAPPAAPENKLDYTGSTMGPVDFNADSFGFDPNNYTSEAMVVGGGSSGSGGSLNLGNILGYVIVGLVGIVILDKVIG